MMEFILYCSLNYRMRNKMKAYLLVVPLSLSGSGSERHPPSPEI